MKKMSYDYDEWVDKIQTRAKQKKFEMPDRVRTIELQRQAAKKIYDERVAQLDAELDRVTRRLEVAEALGGETDPFGDGTVLVIELEFTASPGKVYTYACLRAGGRWYVTTTSVTPGRRWVEFLEWLTADGRNVQCVKQLDVQRLIWSRSGSRNVI